MTKSIVYVAVALLLACSVGGCGEMTEETKRGSFDDAGINTAVEQSLAGDQAKAFSGVGVTTASGTVYLTGAVADTQDKQRAGDLARGVAGVRNVVNNLVLGAGGPAAHAPDHLRAPLG